ncbi:MAG: hypothetical protein NTY81_01120 [Candidatus Staskawiczbacteria bacterium]|nr:hypothetical protein [Candidatus Staskawiczbacteria bacterium]
MVNPILNNDNLKNFIETLKIDEGQKKVLLDKLPQMDGQERIELLKTLKDIYLLNEEEAQAIKKIKDNWEKPVEDKV